MPYHLLKQVIRHLKKTSTCPFCTSKFTDDSIFLLAAGMVGVQDAGGSLFFIVCPQCLSQAFVMVEIGPDKAISVQTKSAEGISVNEVLDMHNFLKNWQGDVKELFNDTKK